VVSGVFLQNGYTTDAIGRAFDAPYSIYNANAWFADFVYGLCEGVSQGRNEGQVERAPDPSGRREACGNLESRA
jgi:hypothetical protein